MHALVRGVDLERPRACEIPLDELHLALGHARADELLEKTELELRARCCVALRREGPHDERVPLLVDAHARARPVRPATLAADLARQSRGERPPEDRVG